MGYFQFAPDSKFPEFYETCQKTGIRKYTPAQKREYASGYFLEEYKNQYNKTYYEDEPNLRRLAKNRLHTLSKFLKYPSGKTLLEVGASCGFFLDEARALGYSVSGIEPSPTEANYAKEVLHLDVVTSGFLEHAVPSKVDVLCMFFVLEHLSEMESVFAKIETLVAPGGFLFLAVPSFFGPTFQTNPKEWFRTHPTDHFYDYSNQSLKKGLRLIGFETVYTKPMSYHQKRDLSFKKYFPAKLFQLYSDFFCYGDTIQILAKQKS